MIDKARDTEVIIAYDILFGVEYLSDFNSDLSFLKRAREILYAHNGCADPDVHAGKELGLKRVGN